MAVPWRATRTIAVLICVLAFAAGCVATRPEPPAAAPVSVSEGSIPFLAVSRGHEAQVYAGEWDVVTARVGVDLEPVLFIQAPDALWWWDGCSGLTLFGPSSPRVSGTGWDIVSIPIPALAGWAVYRSTDGAELAIAHAPAMSAGGSIVLEVRSEGGTERVILAPLPDTDVWRTIDVRPVEQGWEVISQFSRAGTEGIGLALHVVVGGDVDARVVAGDLPIHEAGAGTNVVRGAGHVYIATQEATVLAVNIETGQVRPLSAAMDRLATFAADCVPAVEYLVPPMLSWWDETLIIHWEPAAIEELGTGFGWLPVACVLAIRDGQVLGELRLTDGVVRAYAGDQLQTETHVGDGFPTGWTYPR